jgi:hypothetical protein
MKYIKEGDYPDNKVRELEVNDRVAVWMKQNNIGQEFVVTYEDYDWEAWFEKNPQYQGYTFGDYDLSDEAQAKWIEVVSPEDKTTLIDSGFIMKDVQKIVLEVKEIGYMRKPFRHSETPSRVEGDTLILSVTNFSDEGEKGFDELKKIDAKQTEECNVFIFDVSQLDNIKDYSYSSQEFEKAFIDNWKNEHFVQFNW